MSSTFQEKLLLIRLQKRDPDAFAELYDRYVTQIYRFVFFKVPTRQDAEDITSEVFMKVWQFVTEHDEPVNNLRSFLYRIARNTVIDFYRSRARNEMITDEEVMLEVSDDRQQDFLSQIDAKAEVKSLEKQLRRLKDEYREVLVLRYIEELSISEIADVLQKSKGSVRVLVHRALKVIRDLSNDHDSN